MNLTIDRERWCRGDHHPKLVRKDDGMMCCLGFYLLACGAPRDVILGFGEPQEPFNGIAEVPPAATFLIVPDHAYDEDDCPENENEIVFGASEEAQDLIDANDDMAITEPEREEKIARLFAKQGVVVTFVDRAGEKGSAER